MKMKRWISLLLTLALCLGMLPSSVFATEGAEATSANAPTTTYWESDTIEWSFNESTGLLTISGSGAMPDGSVTWAEDNSSITALLEAPWNVYCKQIVSVSVAEGITTIGARAFKSCANLKNVILPESITSIGADAFNGCAAMEYLYVGSNVAYVRTIDLTTLKDVYYSKSNTNWDNIKGSFPSAARFHSVSAAAYIDGHYSSEITTEATCKATGEKTYSCACEYSFTETIPMLAHEYRNDGVCSCGKVKPLAEGTCGVNEALRWDISADGVLTISGSGAMDRDDREQWSGYRSDIKSLVVTDGVTSIGNGTVGGCTNLTTVSLGKDVTTIGAGSFSSCSGLQNFVIPNSVTLVSQNAFEGCTGIEYFYIPSSVTFVYSSVADNVNPKNIYYAGTADEWASIGAESSDATQGFAALIDDDTLLHCGVAVSGIADHFEPVSSKDATCTAAGEKTYSCDCGYRFTETTPKLAHDYEDDYKCSCGKVKPLAEGTCGANEALRWDISADGVLTISGSGAMDGDDGQLWYSDYRNIITGIVVENGVTSIGASAFVECREAKTVTIGNTVTSIGSGAFSHCYFSEITIPASVTSIEPRAFTFNNLSTFDVAAGNTAFQAVDGVLFSKNGTTLIAYPGWATATEYTIPEGVTTVYEGAFWGCKYLKKLTLSSTMTVPQTGAIGAGFGYLWNLTEYDVTDGNTAFKDENGILLSKDGSTLVSYPNGRKNFVLPNGITTIGSFSIACDQTINTIFIPDTITTIQYGAFADCHNLKTLVIGEYVTTMANRSFAGCGNLDSVYFKGEAPTSFDKNTFKYCDNAIVFYYESEHKASWTNSETGYDAKAQTWNGYPLREVYQIGTTRIGGVDCAYTIGANGVQVFLAQNGVEVAQGSVSINPKDLGSTSVTVQTDKANVTFDKDALAKIRGGQATQIDLSYEEIENPASSGSLTEKQKEAAADAEKVIVLELEDGSAQKVEFGDAAHTNDGSATVTVPYTQKDSDKTPVVYYVDENGNKTPVVYYVDENGNKTPLESTYDAQNGTITFVTSHFSVFAVMEETDLPDGCTQMYDAYGNTNISQPAGGGCDIKLKFKNQDGTYTYITGNETISCDKAFGRLVWIPSHNAWNWQAGTAVPGTTGYIYATVGTGEAAITYAIAAEVTAAEVGVYTNEIDKNDISKGYVPNTNGQYKIDYSNKTGRRVVYFYTGMDGCDFTFGDFTQNDDVTISKVSDTVLKIELPETSTGNISTRVEFIIVAGGNKNSWGYNLFFTDGTEEDSGGNQGGLPEVSLIEAAHTLKNNEKYPEDTFVEHMGAFTLDGDPNTYYLVPSNRNSPHPHLNGDSTSYEAQMSLMYIEFWVGLGQDNYSRVTDSATLNKIKEAFSDTNGNCTLTMDLKATVYYQSPLPTDYPAIYTTPDVDAWRQPITAKFDFGSAGTWLYCASGKIGDQTITSLVRSKIGFGGDIIWTPDTGTEVDVITQVNTYLNTVELPDNFGLIVNLPAGNYSGYITVPSRLSDDGISINGVYDEINGVFSTILNGGVQGENRRTHVTGIHFIGAGENVKEWDKNTVNSGRPNYAYYGSCGGNFGECLFENYDCAVMSSYEIKTGTNSWFKNNHTAVCYNTTKFAGIGVSLKDNLYEDNEIGIHFAQFNNRVGLTILGISGSCFVDNKTDIRNDIKRNIYVPGNYFAYTDNGIEKTRECKYLPQANGNKDKIVHYYPQSANRQFNAWIYDMSFYKHDPVVSANLAATYKIPAEYLTKSVTVMNEDETLAVWTFGKKEEE